jgi:hypothetical protein
MASWDNVRRIALALPEAAERDGREHLQWVVREKLFAWERPLRKGDLAELGDAAPDGPILATRVADEGAKEALIADDPERYFTTGHFDGYPIILARLDRLTTDDLEELLTESWLSRAPKRLAAAYLAARES